MHLKIKALLLFGGILLGLDSVCAALTSNSDNGLPPTVQRKIRGTSIPKATITNNQYSSIPDCGTPSCSNSYHNATLSCPDSCKVTIQVSGTSVTAPVCPAGYMQTAAFNSQPEYQYQNGSSTPIYPSSWSSYNSYKKSTSPIYTEHFDQTTGEYTTDTCRSTTTSYNGDGQTFYNVDYSSTFVVRNGYVYKLRDVWLQCYSAWCVSSAGYFAGIVPYPTDDDTVPSCNDTSTGKIMTYRTKRVYFTKDAGNVATGNTLPGTIICSRVKTTWEN